MNETKFGLSEMFKTFDKIEACKTVEEVYSVIDEVAALNLKNSLTKLSIIKKAHSQITVIKGAN
jgi:hypothetical protein